MKNAIVTGGTKGIGLAVVTHLLQKGYTVYATYAHDEEAKRAAQKSLKGFADRLFFIQLDQADAQAIHQFADNLKQQKVMLSCIVANAGTTVRKSAKEISDEEWEKVMQVCVNGHFYLIRDLWENICPNSRIIFIGSLMGILPHATSLVYAVAKAAVHALAQNLVKEFEGTGTTVNAIAPGFVDSEWQKNKPAVIRENICAKTALHRFATTDEIASAVDFCIENQFLNGEVLKITGGYSYK